MGESEAVEWCRVFVLGNVCVCMPFGWIVRR